MKRAVTALLDEPTFTRLRHWAEQNGRSVSGEMRYALSKYVRDLDTKEKK